MMYFIFLYLICHLVIVTIMDRHSHFGYSYKVAKIYGFKSYFVALFYSYILDPKYMILSLILQKEANIDTISKIEFVCRRFLNSDDKCSVKFHSDKVIFVYNNVFTCGIELNQVLGIVDISWNHNVIMHPRTIKLIEACKIKVDSNTKR